MFSSVTIDTVTFNNGTSGYWIEGTQGLEVPPIRVASYNLAGQDYGQHVSAFYGRRAFALDGTIVGTDASDFIAKRDALYAALNVTTGRKTITFTLANGRSVQIVAILIGYDGPPTAGQPTAGPFQARFEAAFPYLLSSSSQLATLTLPLGGGTAVPLLAVPASLSASTGGSLTLSNAGNAPTLPTARISGPVTNPAIRNMTTGEELTFTLELLAGEYIDVDFLNHTVVDNTGRSRYDTKTGDWWTLAPGSTTVRFVADSTDAAAQAALTYRDAWLGI